MVRENLSSCPSQEEGENRKHFKTGDETQVLITTSFEELFSCLKTKEASQN